MRPDPRAQPGYVEALTRIVAKIAASLGEVSPKLLPIRLYVAGGAALHLRTGSRVTADIDAVFRTNNESRTSGAEAEPAPVSEGPNWVSFIRSLPKPTIAAVNGVAVGIGVTQVLPMDFRLAAEEARFGMFFVKMGLVPELASSALLPQMVGQARALDWCLTGRMIGANEAREAGMVSEVVPATALLDRAVALGEQLAGQSAFAMTKIRQLVIENTTETNLDEAMRREGRALNATYASWEHREAIDAFLAKRPADFGKSEPTAAS